MKRYIVCSFLLSINLIGMEIEFEASKDRSLEEFSEIVREKYKEAELLLAQVQELQKLLAQKPLDISLKAKYHVKLKNAVQIYLDIAQQNIIPELAAEAQYRLGRFCSQGNGVIKRNYVKARNFFLVAAASDQENVAKIRSFGRLGEIHLYGFGMAEDLKTAEIYLKHAENQTLCLWTKVHAQYNLAQLYFIKAKETKEHGDMFHAMAVEKLIFLRDQTINDQVREKAEEEYGNLFNNNSTKLIHVLHNIFNKEIDLRKKAIVAWDLSQLYLSKRNMLANKSSQEAREYTTVIKQYLWLAKTQRDHKGIQHHAEIQFKNLNFFEPHYSL